MPESIREEKLKLIEKLPQRLSDFLYSEDTGAFLLYLGKKYNLPDEKVSAISTIIVDIILKITPITSLAQEIANKVIPDHQTAMSIAQELNSELLTPVLMPVPAAPMPTPVMPPAPKPVMPATLTPQPAPISKTDQYREPPVVSRVEPVREAPEIIDLRKTPPPPMQMPVAAAPIPPTTIKIEPLRPLTFTKPVEPPVKIELPVVNKIEPIKPIPSIPLIEAEPHKMPAPISEEPQPPVVSRVEPQYIIRPPGLAPTDLPHDVLDLRKDKGEF